MFEEYPINIFRLSGLIIIIIHNYYNLIKWMSIYLIKIINDKFSSLFDSIDLHRHDLNKYCWDGSIFPQKVLWLMIRQLSALSLRLRSRRLSTAFEFPFYILYCRAYSTRRWWSIEFRCGSVNNCLHIWYLKLDLLFLVSICRLPIMIK